MTRVSISIISATGLHEDDQLADFYGKPLARKSDLFFLAYALDELVGAVRFCVEEDVPLLRSMVIKETAQRKGIGTQLLHEFEAHLRRTETRNIYCLPYAHLTEFYAQIGFRQVAEETIPLFLQKRLMEYRTKPGEFICMHRA